MLNGSTGREGRRFRIALTVFGLWLAALATLAIFSSQRPAADPSRTQTADGPAVRQP